MAEITGIDISNWQGAVNWDAIFGSGVAFAIVKASESTNYKDVQLDRNKSEMRRVGIPHGFYHFARGGNPEAEADVFVGSVGDIKPGEVLALDWEIAYGGDADDWAARFIKRVRVLTGVTCLFYASESVIMSKSWEKVRATGAGLWCAKYGSNNGQRQGEPARGGWDIIAMWQYTSVAAITGIGGHVDADVFFGDAASFLKYGAPGAVSAPAAPLPTPVPAVGVNSQQTYTVVAGDSLSGIAAKFGTTYQALAQLNGLANANLIFPGQVLRVTSAVPATLGSGTVYTVVSGDNLSAIGKKFGVSYQAIAAANGIADPNKIFAGQRLTIPGASAAAPVATGQTYSVVGGDTLSGIAAKFGTNWQHLAQVNGIADPNRIFPGQVLKIT